MGSPQEATARGLHAALTSAGLPAHLHGQGVHWRVDAHVGARRLRVHCFWYGDEAAALQLGMNPANARRQLGPATRAPYAGPEYAVTLQDSSLERPLEGRSRTPEPVVVGARAWLGGVSVEKLAVEAPFIDAQGRAMRAVAAHVDARLRWDLERDPSHELWIYGQGRSCRVTGVEEQLGCACFLGQAQVAWLAAPDVATVTRQWLLDRVALRDLSRWLPDVTVEPYALLLDEDPAAWHWAHFHERIVDPSDVLAPMRELLEALERSPVARRFYTFSSLDRLCFSASSHYPWVNDGLPVVARGLKGYVVAAEPCDVATAVQRIEAALSAFPVTPFFGSAVHLDHRNLTAVLAAQGSPLQPRLVQRGAWETLEVESPDGTRRCRVFDCSPGSCSAELVGPQRESTRQSWPDFDALVAGIHSFLEGGATP